MNRRLVIVLVVALLLAILSFTIYVLTQRLTKQRDEIERMQANNAQLLLNWFKSASLNLTLKEARMADSLKIDSLAKVLRVRPKTITNVIQVTKTIYDTLHVPVSVILQKDGWQISDSGCNWRYQANARLILDSLAITRTLFTQDEKFTYLFFWERPTQIWFLHIGKKKYYQIATSTCGSTQIRAIQIIKH